jgi:mono/diheme cytochrome c family protein
VQQELAGGVVSKFVRVIICAATLSFGAGYAAAEEEKAAGIKNPHEGRTELIEEGKSLFNQYCSHCHGPDAVQGEKPRDLRRLTRRYGDGATEMFYTTVNNGRMDKGMPVWKGVIEEDVMWRIYTFLQSVQVK